MLKWGIPRRSNRVHPQLLPCPTLFYVIAIIYGDGYKFFDKKKKNYRIGLGSPNKVFTHTFFHALRFIRLNPYIRLDKRKTWWVEAHSKIFYNYLSELSIKELTKLLLLKKKYTIAFLRGFYESEGWLTTNKRNYKILGIVNTNREVMELVKTLLYSLGMHPRFYSYHYPPRKVFYQLYLLRQSEVNLFFKCTTPAIKRMES